MIPMTLVTKRSLELVKTHLQSLTPLDRYLRFGAFMSDEVIAEYVESNWNDSKNEWLGIIEDGKIIAAIHIAKESDAKSELGLSVDPAWRGKKLGQALFERAALRLRAGGVKEVYMHCLSENAVMKHIASKNHMKMFTSYGETDADLVLPDHTPIDTYQEVLVEQLAIYDNNARAIRNSIKHFWDPHENN